MYSWHEHQAGMSRSRNKLVFGGTEAFRPWRHCRQMGHCKKYFEDGSIKRFQLHLRDSAKRIKSVMTFVSNYAGVERTVPVEMSCNCWSSLYPWYAPS